jgi:hypothetical protein
VRRLPFIAVTEVDELSSLGIRGQSDFGGFKIGGADTF